MSSAALRVVQFVHPGFEYHRREHLGPKHKRSGMMRWKPGCTRHDRKFMLTWGSFIESGTGRAHTSVPLALWGEWEAPSVFWRLESTGKPLPTVVHAPFLPASCPGEPVQNSDPMVFGDSFIYSNCLQPAYPSLRTLSPGSIVLFGRFGRARGQGCFSLDTCLVVDRVQDLPPVPFDRRTYGSDLLTDAVLSPLHSEGADGDLTVYFGVRRSPGPATPFSFFPAQMMDDRPPVFGRPDLRPIGALDGVISPGKMQGIKVTSNLSLGDRDAIWDEVVEQVTRQGCGLGYYASPPPVLEEHLVQSAAENAPMPFPPLV